MLAHEILHVWLNQHGIKLSSSKTEGFCNLGAMLVYENDNSKFAEILLDNMEQDPDPDYGKGYKKMKDRLNRIGWQSMRQELINKAKYYWF